MIFSNSWAKSLFVAVYLVAVPAVAADPSDVKDIAKELRCLTCPNETIAESSTPMALDVKHYINDHLDKGDDTDTIILNLTKRYGEHIRYNPTMANHNLFLWLTPLLCMMIGCVMLFQLFHKRKTA